MLRNEPRSRAPYVLSKLGREPSDRRSEVVEGTSTREEVRGIVCDEKHASAD